MSNTTIPMMDLVGMDCINTGDTTWVLVSSILVLSMMPALSFFEAGLLKSVNTVSLVTQIIGGVSILSVMWHLFGYTLVFGHSWGGFIGNFENVLMLGVTYDTCSRHAPNIPSALFGFFQMMFAAISPLLITGAFAERLRFKAYIIFIIVWEIFIYYPVAHWIWGDGWMGKMGVLDFAGGIVIHTTSGVSALICGIVLGHRKDFDKYHGEFPPSNLPLAALGGALLWTSWFGFNAGSALSSGPLAVSTVVATQRAAVCSGVVWLILSWIRHKPSAVAVLNGVIAGLAGITPASGYIDPQFGTVIGVILGLASYFSIILFKIKLRIDDALDVSSVHGMTGIVGSLSIGFFAQKAFNPEGADGLFFGDYSPYLLGVQTMAVVVSGAWSAFWTFLALKIIDKIVGLKLTGEEELGLDDSEHGEQAYGWRHASTHVLLSDQQVPFLSGSSVNGHGIDMRTPLLHERASYGTKDV
jgi:Amt family ammonium transporter